MGELQLRQLRAEAEAALGSQFQLPEWHRTVLQCPGPLSVLQRCSEEWSRTAGLLQQGGVQAGGGAASLTPAVLITVGCWAVTANQYL